jgi:hypothetical protein
VHFVFLACTFPSRFYVRQSRADAAAAPQTEKVRHPQLRSKISDTYNLKLQYKCLVPEFTIGTFPLRRKPHRDDNLPRLDNASRNDGDAFPEIQSLD